ncbi:hypothetical protein F0562_013336 [Nyssa sinensis]|uniref:Uncharacterized protein n=1 Tax=Nyssa sinensis TaxID=561372 RepID=A0A5J4ZK60_9ASTE|nr:hypothetical protein F0562_013336 [Nyssa sinensis]
MELWPKTQTVAKLKDNGEIPALSKLRGAKQRLQVSAGVKVVQLSGGFSNNGNGSATENQCNWTGGNLLPTNSRLEFLETMFRVQDVIGAVKRNCEKRTARLNVKISVAALQAGLEVMRGRYDVLVQVDEKPYGAQSDPEYPNEGWPDHGRNVSCKRGWAAINQRWSPFK